MDLDGIGRLLIGIGVMIFLLGGLFLLLSKVPGLVGWAVCPAISTSSAAVFRFFPFDDLHRVERHVNDHLAIVAALEKGKWSDCKPVTSSTNCRRN